MEAINTLREQFHNVTFVWVPAHAGIACNAYADAAAKSALGAEVKSPVLAMVAADIKSRYVVYGGADDDPSDLL